MRSWSGAALHLGMALASALVALVLFVAVFEVVQNVRYYRWRRDFTDSGWLGRLTIASPNPVLMWEYRPYGTHLDLETNRYGFRERDLETPEKPEGVLRVAFVGDSVTLGFGVAAEETFVRRFEVEANRGRAGPRVEALNFAVDGYNAVQIAELVRSKVLAFSPDHVVYTLCWNDFDFWESAGDKIRYFRKPTFFFVRVVERAYRRAFRIDDHLFHYARNRDVVLEEILRMQALADGAGAAFRVAILPVFFRHDASFEGYRLAGLHRELGAFLEAHGIPYVDLLGAFAAAGAPPASWAPDVWHPTAEGHALIARTLLPSVLGGGVRGPGERAGDDPLRGRAALATPRRRAPPAGRSPRVARRPRSRSAGGAAGRSPRRSIPAPW